MLNRDLYRDFFQSPAPPSRRVLFVVAHPDDEVIGAGAQLPRWPDAEFVHVTDGAPRDLNDARAAGCTTRHEYSRVRRNELFSALAHVGIAPEQCTGLGFVDQEASRHLVRLTRRLTEALLETRPEIVITHPYEGGHPDHDATAFAVHEARDLLEQQNQPAPLVIEMTSYHNRAGIMASGEFLPCPGSPLTTLVLSDPQRRLKQRLFECFATQRKVLAGFAVQHERFRPAPRYDFNQPPHEGTLYYEMFDWGMTGGEWRHLAKAALEELRNDRAIAVSAWERH